MGFWGGGEKPFLGRGRRLGRWPLRSLFLGWTRGCRLLLRCLFCCLDLFKPVSSEYKIPLM